MHASSASTSIRQSTRDYLVVGSVDLDKYDFRVLDRLQALLEEEAAERVRGLYGL
jgi:hypothetical protein